MYTQDHVFPKNTYIYRRDMEGLTIVVQYQSAADRMMIRICLLLSLLLLLVLLLLPAMVSTTTERGENLHSTKLYKFYTMFIVFSPQDTRRTRNSRWTPDLTRLSSWYWETEEQRRLQSLYIRESSRNLEKNSHHHQSSFQRRPKVCGSFGCSKY